MIIQACLRVQIHPPLELGGNGREKREKKGLRKFFFEIKFQYFIIFKKADFFVFFYKNYIRLEPML
jgi:hypothetical protein